jgi:hypothetical protein
MNKMLITKDSKTGKIEHFVVRQLPADYQFRVGEIFVRGKVILSIVEV